MYMIKKIPDQDEEWPKLILKPIPNTGQKTFEGETP